MDSIRCFPPGQLCGGQIKGRHQKLTCSSFILKKGRIHDLWLLLNGKEDAKRRVCDAALLGTLILETTNLLSEPQEFPTASQTTIPILLPSMPTPSHWYQNKQTEKPASTGQRGGSRRGQRKSGGNFQARHRPASLQKCPGTASTNWVMILT